jgi:hypothetical protein
MIYIFILALIGALAGALYKKTGKAALIGAAIGLGTGVLAFAAIILFFFWVCRTGC